MDWIFHTYDSFAFVILRFGLAVTFFMHGTQHAFGWHGGKGPKAQVTNWRDKYHIPVPMGVFALVIELSTVVSMTLGFFVRPVAFCLAVFIGFAMVLESLGATVSFSPRHPARAAASSTRSRYSSWRWRSWLAAPAHCRSTAC